MAPKKQLRQREARLRQRSTLAGDRTCSSRFFFEAGRHLQRTPSSISIGTEVECKTPQRNKRACKGDFISHVFSFEQSLSLHHVTLTMPLRLFAGIVITCKLSAGTNRWEKRIRYFVSGTHGWRRGYSVGPTSLPCRPVLREPRALDPN